MSESPKPAKTPLAGHTPDIPTGIAASARAIARGIAIAVWTPSLFAVRVAAAPLGLFAPGAERAFRNWIFSAWARGVLRIAGFRVHVEGTPPKPPFVLVSNHLSYVDVVVYIALVSGAFVSMAEVRSWPGLGFIARHMNTVFVNRQSRRDALRVNDSIDRAIDDGYGITLFPEGTTSNGEDVRPFKTALLEPMARRQIPVHYAVIRYETLPGDPPPSLAVCWVDNAPFAAHASGLLRLRRTDVRVRFGSETVIERDRKALASALRENVRRNLETGS
jgi:1-acyl-sn-glycerol-3-phosphate acyltransferase